MVHPCIDRLGVGIVILIVEIDLFRIAGGMHVAQRGEEFVVERIGQVQVVGVFRFQVRVPAIVLGGGGAHLERVQVRIIRAGEAVSVGEGQVVLVADRLADAHVGERPGILAGVDRIHAHVVAMAVGVFGTDAYLQGGPGLEGMVDHDIGGRDQLVVKVAVVHAAAVTLQVIRSRVVVGVTELDAGFERSLHIERMGIVHLEAVDIGAERLIHIVTHRIDRIPAQEIARVIAHVVGACRGAFVPDEVEIHAELSVEGGIESVFVVQVHIMVLVAETGIAFLVIGVEDGIGIRGFVEAGAEKVGIVASVPSAAFVGKAQHIQFADIVVDAAFPVKAQVFVAADGLVAFGSIDGVAAAVRVVVVAVHRGSLRALVGGERTIDGEFLVAVVEVETGVVAHVAVYPDAGIHRSGEAGGVDAGGLEVDDAAGAFGIVLGRRIGHDLDFLNRVAGHAAQVVGQILAVHVRGAVVHQD